MKKRIVCIGNRFVTGDDAGPKVYDYLTKSSIPDGIQVVEGGLSGLDLLKYIEDADRVVFVDTVKGYGGKGEIVVLDRLMVAETTDTHYGHSAGLAYLLKMLPFVYTGDIPEILLVGVEGNVDKQTVKVLADVCMEIVRYGMKDLEQPLATTKQNRT